MPIPLTLNGREHQGFMKQHDMFGHPIGFNFEGYETHNTAFGGCCSILIKLELLQKIAVIWRRWFGMMPTAKPKSIVVDSSRILIQI